MVKALIIEDEVNARAALKKMIQLINPEIEIVGESAYVQESIALIKSLQPNLIFMDIELEDGNSFEILKSLTTFDFKIIFTTAYNHHAIKAFKYSAIDYLLKPINPEELRISIKKVIKILTEEIHYSELLKVLKENLEKKNEKIVLKTAEQTFIIPIKDIIRLQADGAYTVFVTNKEKLVVSKNIKYYQGLLNDGFIRCHQSHLVNHHFVESIEKGEYLKMTNEDLVPISTRKKSEISDFFKSL